MNIPLRDYLALLGKYLRPRRGPVVALAVLLLVSIGLQAANPQLIRVFIDRATTGSSSSSLALIAIAFIGLALLTQTLAIAATYVSETVGWTATNALREDLVSHCLRLDMGFHKSRTPGEMIQRVDGDVDALSNFFSQFVIYVLGNTLLLAIVLALLFLEDWRVGLGLTLFAGGALGSLVQLRSLAVPHWAAVREEQAKFYGFVGESLAAREDTRANGARGYVMTRFLDHLRRWLPFQQRSGMGGAYMWMSSLGLFTIGNAVAFALSYHLYRSGVLSLGAVYLVFHYTELLRRPIDQIRAQIQDLQSATASIGRVRSLLDRQSNLEDGGGEPLPTGALGVDIQGLGFSYDGEESVLHDVSLAIRPGAVLGLLGRTGSGKTTLSRLLMRFYDPQSGEVHVGGAPVSSPRLSDLRRKVGMVTQEVQVFNASVRENLTFFDETVSDERLLRVLADLGLRPWLESLPDGLDTHLASDGLSAGEAQLLAFARVFLREPGLIVLDEASSRLDPATERLIDRALDSLLKGRTAIIVAHRLSTVARADDIAILEHGRIVEYGPRKALAEDESSRYFGLLQTGLEVAAP